MIVVRYNDKEYNPAEVKRVYDDLKSISSEDVLVIPQDWDILFKCSTADLYGYIDYIKKLIEQKESGKQNE